MRGGLAGQISRVVFWQGLAKERVQRLRDVSGKENEWAH